MKNLDKGIPHCLQIIFLSFSSPLSGDFFFLDIKGDVGTVSAFGKYSQKLINFNFSFFLIVLFFEN